MIENKNTATISGSIWDNPYVRVMGIIGHCRELVCLWDAFHSIENSAHDSPMIKPMDLASTPERSKFEELSNLKDCIIRELIDLYIIILRHTFNEDYKPDVKTMTIRNIDASISESIFYCKKILEVDRLIAVRKALNDTKMADTNVKAFNLQVNKNLFPVLVTIAYRNRDLVNDRYNRFSEKMKQDR